MKDKLSKLRKGKNLTQEALAEKLNVTRQTISKWELGETSPNIEQVKEIAKVFNVSIDSLISDNKKKRKLLKKYY